MRGPQQTFIGPRRRARIITAIAGFKGKWQGKRGPMAITIANHAHMPTLEGHTISFSGRIFRDTVGGTAGTVGEAIEKLELVFRERTLQHDPRNSGTDERRRRSTRDTGKLQGGPVEKTHRRQKPRATPAKARSRKRGKK